MNFFFLPDGVVVHGGRQRHEHVPDGVGEGDDAVRLEEDHAQAVDEAPERQLHHTLRVALREGGEEVSRGGGWRGEEVSQNERWEDG